MAANKPEKVTRGNGFLMVYPWQDPRTKRTKALAIAAAWELQEESWF